MAFQSGRVRLHWLVFAYGGMALIAMTSLFWSIEPVRTINASLRMLAIALFLPGLWLIVRTSEGFSLFTATFLTVSAMAVVLGLLFWWEPGSRWMLNQGPAQIGMLFFASMVVALVRWRMTGAKLYLVIASISLIPMFAVGSLRGLVAGMSLIGVVAAHATWANLRSMRVRRWFGGFGTALLILAMAGVSYTLLGERAQYRIDRYVGHAISMVTQQDTSGQTGGLFGRIDLYVGGQKIALEQKSLFGTGLNTTYRLLEEEIGWATYTHVDFLEVFIGLGVVGFIIFYGTLIIVGLSVLRQRRMTAEIRVIAFGALLGILLISLTGRIYNVLPVWIILIILCSVPHSCMRWHRERPLEPRAPLAVIR